MRAMLIFYAVCIATIIFSALSITWWWLEFQLRYWVLRRMAASLHQMADQIEDALEKLHGLNQESAKHVKEIETLCKEL